MKKLKTIIIPLALLVCMILLAVYRLFYGVWNPFILPDRIECYDRRYYISNDLPKELIQKEKPSYSIYSLNILTGKKLYTTDPKRELVPTIIYLYIGDGIYQEYALGGGP